MSNTVEILKAIFDAFQSMINRLASVFSTVAETLTRVLSHEATQTALVAGSFFVAQAVLVFSAAVPMILVSLGLGLLGGFAIIGVRRVHNPLTETEYKQVEKIVPYDQWPDECYICMSEIDSHEQVRGQFVVHKGESETETKAVPLCEQCTWTYSTLIDNHEPLVGFYDCRDDPVEL